MPQQSHPMKRIAFLDGFRGLAILLVVFYHAYTRWGSVVPYGNTYADFPVFREGFLGVQLFFLISGFVILMSLEKSSAWLPFLKRRWYRLFPAMFIATVVVFVTAQFLPERPTGIPQPAAVISGLLFVEPSWIRMLTSFKTGQLEGAFWSLFVEVKFYVIFGALYFYKGSRKAITGILLCYLLWMGTFLLDAYGIMPLPKYLNFVIFHLSFLHFGWFAAGALTYRYYKDKNTTHLALAFLIGLLAIVSLHKSPPATWMAAGLLLLLFLAVVYFETMQKLLANKALLFFGFISYPLYLIHENTMIALILKWDKYLAIPQGLLPILPIALLMAVAYVIAKYLEPLLLKGIKKIV